MGNENAGGKDNYILILDFPYPLIFVMDRKLAFWLFSKTMLMLLFSFPVFKGLLVIWFIMFINTVLGHIKKKNTFKVELSQVVIFFYHFSFTWFEVKVAQSCPTLWDPVDYTVHGILQAIILEWVALPFSRRSSQYRGQTKVSHIAGEFFTSWVTREAQEYSRGLSSPADLPVPGIKQGSPALQADQENPNLKLLLN